MEKWSGKVALVTGASSGIGAAIVLDLAKEGMVVIGVARRLEKLKELQNQLGKAKGSLHIKQFDISKLDEIPRLFEEIKKEFGGVDVLINNAAIIRMENRLTETPTKNLVDVITTNVLGLAVATREAVAQMKAKAEPAHIININSIDGHKVYLSPDFSGEIYDASKFAVTAISEISRYEMALQDAKIKITNLSPGAVATEILGPDTKKLNQAMGTDKCQMSSEDISDAVKYVLGTPEHVLISELMIRHIHEKF